MKTHVGRFQVVDEPEELARVAAGLLVDAARTRPRRGLADDRAVPIDHAESKAAGADVTWLLDRDAVAGIG